MRRLFLHSAGQVLPWFGLTLLSAVFLFLFSQGMRVAPVFLGADMSPVETLRMLGLLMVPVLGWAIAPAYLVGVFAGVSGLARFGELTALDAAGISRLRTATGPGLLLLLLVMVSAGIWLMAAPASQSAIRVFAHRMAGRAISGQLEPGVFISPVSDITFFARDRDRAGNFVGIMMEDRRFDQAPVQLFAEMASSRFDSTTGALNIRFKHGRLFRVDERGVKTTAGFAQLDMSVDLLSVLSEKLVFLPPLMAVPSSALFHGSAKEGSECAWVFEKWRRVMGPAGLMVLGLFGLTLAFRTSHFGRGWSVCAGALVFLGWHLAGRLGEILVEKETLGPIAGAVLPTMSILSAWVIAFLVDTAGKSTRRLVLRR